MKIEVEKASKNIVGQWNLKFEKAAKILSHNKMSPMALYSAIYQEVINKNKSKQKM